MCNIFHMLPRLLLCRAFPLRALQRGDWTAGEPMGGGAAGYLNSPHTAQLNQTTSTDFSNIILSQGSVIIKRALSLLPWAQKGEQGTFFVFFNPFSITFKSSHQDGNLLLLFTSGSLLMHLLIGGNSLCLTMDKVAVMKSDTLLHLEDNRRAEERSRLNCVDLPRSSLTDGENIDLLRCQDTTENSSPIKYRRYGYALFVWAGNIVLMAWSTAKQVAVLQL